MAMSHANDLKKAVCKTNYLQSRKYSKQ